jgi:hypothetical protein
MVEVDVDRLVEPKAHRLSDITAPPKRQQSKLLARGGGRNLKAGGLMRALSMMLVIGAALVASSCDAPKGNPPIDLAYNPFIDLAYNPNAPSEPTCVPPTGGDPKTMMVTCPSGTSLYSSEQQSGCFPNGKQPGGSIPFVNECDSTTPVFTCTHSPNCSFCLPFGSAPPPGCHQCNGNC